MAAEKVRAGRVATATRRNQTLYAAASSSRERCRRWRPVRRTAPSPTGASSKILQAQEPGGGIRRRAPGPPRAATGISTSTFASRSIYARSRSGAILLKLKADQTPVYNLVRSLGLVGPLPGRDNRDAPPTAKAHPGGAAVPNIHGAARRVRGMELRGAGAMGRTWGSSHRAR